MGELDLVHLRIFAFGFAMLLVGAYVTMTPLDTAAALGKPHETSSQLINLRASWGGPLLGLGALVAWLPAISCWHFAASRIARSIPSDSKRPTACGPLQLDPMAALVFTSKRFVTA